MQRSGDSIALDVTTTVRCTGNGSTVLKLSTSISKSVDVFAVMDGFAGWIECNEAGLNNFKLSSTLTSKEERNGLYHHIGMQRQLIFASKRSLIAQFEPKSPVQERTAATFGICFATEATPDASANGCER
jgi:hypothetical protein